MPVHLRFFFAAALLFGFRAVAAEPLPRPASTPWDVEALSKAPAFEWVNKDSPVKSLTYRGLPGDAHRAPGRRLSGGSVPEGAGLLCTPIFLVEHGNHIWRRCKKSRGPLSIGRAKTVRASIRKEP